ncbi:MAG: alcohol dehydrogenase catalytic domain-containing protein [Bryobacterales bacterium]|nr:alcohol dehydrogenase catalytic domain-containing protein [Bryobacterales bacterium]
MRLAELYEPRRFRVVDADIQDPAPGEIQVRVKAVGICGSDTHNFLEGGIGDTPCPYPMVLGHEPSGVVVKTGPGVTGWAPGDRAALEPAIYCYHCEFCRSGRHNLCARIRFMSTPPDAGYFRQYVNLPAENLLPISPRLSFEYATLFEPLAVVLHSVKLAAVRPLESAAVLGAGPIGLMTVILLKICGAGRVYLVEPVAHRRHMGKQAGADAVIDPAETDASAVILNETGGRGVDLAIDCAARGDSLGHCVKSVCNGGRMVVTGIPVEVCVSLDWHVARRKELTILNVRRSNHDSEAALTLLEEHSSRFAPLITHTLPMERVQEAFEMLELYSDGAGKVVLTP